MSDKEKKDSLTVDMLKRWVRSYAELLRSSPGSAERLKSRSKEFELVPVPKELMKVLALELASRGCGKGIDTETAAAVNEAVAGFFNATGEGSVEKALSFVSEDYKGFDNSEKQDLKTALEGFVKNVGKVEIDVGEMEGLTMGEGRVAGFASGSYQGEAGKKDFTFEVVLTKEDGAWLVASIRTGFF